MHELREQEFHQPYTVTGVAVASDPDFYRGRPFRLKLSDYKDLKRRDNYWLSAGKTVILLGLGGLAQCALSVLAQSDRRSYLSSNWTVWAAELGFIVIGFVLCALGAWYCKSPYKRQMELIDEHFEKYPEA